ncbi:hypothetical protein [Vulcanisaeta sp. JCM 14467]
MRGSGTEPIIRIYAEAPTQERLNQIINHTTTLIKP